MRIETGGIELHYDVHGTGRPLLWLHGFMGHGPDWRFVFPNPPEDFQLVSPDLRGQGRSTGDEAPRYSFKQSALDVLALIEHLGLPAVNVVGLSGGGITALHLATLAPVRVADMVIVSAPPRFPDQARAIQRVYSTAMLSDEELARMRGRHSRPGQIDHLLAQARSMADGDDPDFSRDALAAISARTLIVFGDRDPLYPVSLAVELREAMPRSFLWVVPNGGHGPIFGANANRFREVVGEFFADQW